MKVEVSATILSRSFGGRDRERKPRAASWHLGISLQPAARPNATLRNLTLSLDRGKLSHGLHFASRLFARLRIKACPQPARLYRANGAATLYCDYAPWFLSA